MEIPAVAMYKLREDAKRRFVIFLIFFFSSPVGYPTRKAQGVDKNAGVAQRRECNNVFVEPGCLFCLPEDFQMRSLRRAQTEGLVRQTCRCAQRQQNSVNRLKLPYAHVASHSVRDG